jgi:resuscitation-promoting factor RpfB
MVIWGCSATRITQELINISITADDRAIQLSITSGSTVQEALKSAEVTLGSMDQVDPPVYTVLSDGAQVKVIRVREEYYIEQVIIPFEHQELRNEALPEGERRLTQPGVNGLEEITYHRIFEDEVEVSDNMVSSTVLEEAIPEVVMIGSRSTFTSFAIPGRIAYLSAGNAWVIENSTGNRRLVVSTGDLDGRIFSLSNDGDYLLFTRYSNKETFINSLWVAAFKFDPVRIIDLGVENIVHFAEFNPSSKIVAYSTAEWRETSPGWQANNDLYELSVSESGFVGSPRMDIESNSGGVYGWWGMEFSWSPDKPRFLYSRPDSIGIFDSRDGTQTSILNIVPYQTGGNWAWVPGVAWSPDGNVVYAVTHASSEASSSDKSQAFDLLAIPLLGGSPANLVNNVGMFAYPIPSPINQINKSSNQTSGDALVEYAFSVAYLQAVFPDQSETSPYRLFIIDRDGSNPKSLFPEEGAVGLDPQHVVWSPISMGSDENYAIALIYNGDIWIIDTGSGVAQQITGDGLTSRLDWR